VAAHPLRRRLIAFLSAMFAALFVGSLAPAPAHATYGPPQTVTIQLRSYDSYGNEYRVGRLVGTVQFDDGNSAYYLSLVMCRQSSYTNPHLRIHLNNGTVYHQFFSPSDNTRRPVECDGGHGMSGTVVGGFGYGGVISNLTISLEGIHFDMSTARTVSRSATYDNPYN
jgi:hypothetical protein